MDGLKKDIELKQMNINNQCKILDEDEEQKYNFRNWTVEEIEKRNFPFERFQKKDFPFLFKKKNNYIKEDTKISLNEIITKVKDLSMNSPILSYIQNDIVPNLELNEEDISHTPKFSPYLTAEELINDLKTNDTNIEDG